MKSRAENLFGPLPSGARILEIGPSYNPLFPKGGPQQVHVLDHATREELVAKYRDHPSVDTTRIEEVDHVWTNGPLHEAVPRDMHGQYDAFVASHVIEHTPDLVGFLKSAGCCSGHPDACFLWCLTGASVSTSCAPPQPRAL